MRILVVDDEQPARERLKRLLDGIEGVELVGEAEEGPQDPCAVPGARLLLPGYRNYSIFRLISHSAVAVSVPAPPSQKSLIPDPPSRASSPSPPKTRSALRGIGARGRWSETYAAFP